MRTEENYSKDRHQRRKRIPFFSLAAALAFSCSLEALSFRAELSCSKVSTQASRILTFFRLPPRRLLKSSHLLKLLCLVSCQLEILPSPLKELGLFNNLLSQILSTKQSQDRVLGNTTKVPEVQKILTTREE